MRLLLIAVAVAGGMIPAQAWAQIDTVAVSGEPSCATCTIALTKVAEIGRAGDPFPLALYSSVYRGPGNQFIVVNAIDDSNKVLLYDSAGVYVREIGQQGRGPGQFAAWAFWLGLGRGDSLYFRDRGRQYHVFGPDLQSARAIPVSTFSSSGALALQNGNLVAYHQPADRGRTHPMQIISGDGRVVRELGILTPDEKYECLSCSQRLVVTAADRSSFFVARANQYRLERYNLDGAPRMIAIVNDSPWMKPWLAEPNAPFSKINDVVDTGNNRLLVIGRVPAAGTGSFLDANTASWPTSLERHHSTVMEIVDLQRRNVVVSRRFEREYYMVVDARHVARQRSSDSRFVSFDIYRVDVTGAERSTMALSAG